MNEIERLAQVAEEELSRQATILRDLRLELERNSEILDARSYSDLRARIELHEMRVETATRKAREKQAALDDARSAEVAKLAHEQAQRNYDGKLAELHQVQTEIETKAQAIRDLNQQMPLLQQKKSQILLYLSKAKDAVQESEQISA